MAISLHIQNSNNITKFEEFCFHLNIFINFSIRISKMLLFLHQLFSHKLPYAVYNVYYNALLGNRIDKNTKFKITKKFWWYKVKLRLLLQSVPLNCVRNILKSTVFVLHSITIPLFPISGSLHYSLFAVEKISWIICWDS